MISDIFSIVVVGLPESGKTTYLAALYETVRARDAATPELKLRQEPVEREYLFEISQTWLRLEQATHSNVSGPQDVLLPLVAFDGVSLDLRVPDVAGEQFNAVWEGESLPEAIEGIGDGGDGILLFVSARDVVAPRLLPPGGAVGSGAGGSAPAWPPAEAPTQTKIADLIEILESTAMLDRPLAAKRPIAVIVSAWDTVEPGLKLTPKKWLKFKLPLVWQVLQAGEPERAFEVFGVSAQGGDYADPDAKTRLSETSPEFRASIQVGDAVSHDLSKPVAWLAGQRIDP